MKVYLCGSFKFLNEMTDVCNQITANNISCSMSKPNSSLGMKGCLNYIEEADVIYVVNPDGYIGKSVSVDIGFALALKRRIFSMKEITDPPISELLSGAISTQDLIQTVHEFNSNKE